MAKKPGRPKTVNDATSSPWTIRGVNHETREAVKKAAKKENITLGEYVDRHLLDASHETLGTGTKTKKEIGPTVEEMMSDFIKEFATQKVKMEEMAKEMKEVRDYQTKSWLKKLTG